MPAKRTRSESPPPRAPPRAESPRKRRRREPATRRRSQSDADVPTLSPPASQPLTKANLELLKRSHGCSDTSVSSAMAPSTKSGSNTNLDDRNKLFAYNVLVDHGVSIPTVLAEHISENITKSREGAASPHAQHAVGDRRRGALQNEATGVNIFEPHLLAGLQGQSNGGTPFITYDLKVRLARTSLPLAPYEEVKDAYGPLSQPEPDIAYGYIPRSEALTKPNIQHAFTAKEELALAGFRLSSYQHFPFLTVQWKSPTGTETMFHAHNQSGRDGATIVNHLHELYKTAYGREPTVVEASHFSMTVDMMNVNFFAHWRDMDRDEDDKPIVVHHMELFYECSLRDVVAVEHARNIVKNIAAYAVGERLASIKAALALFMAKGKRPLPSASETMVESQTTEPYSDSFIPDEYIESGILAPLTPRSSRAGKGSQTSKRPRKV